MATAPLYTQKKKIQYVEISSCHHYNNNQKQKEGKERDSGCVV
jgi:hypothetical protein